MSITEDKDVTWRYLTHIYVLHSLVASSYPAIRVDCQQLTVFNLCRSTSVSPRKLSHLAPKSLPIYRVMQIEQKKQSVMAVSESVVQKGRSNLSSTRGGWHG